MARHGSGIVWLMPILQITVPVGNGLPDAALMRRRIFVSLTRSHRPQNLIQMVNSFVNLSQSLPGWLMRICSAPWEAPRQILDAANLVLGQTYPHPIVDVKSSRLDALAAFAALRNAV